MEFLETSVTIALPGNQCSQVGGVIPAILVLLGMMWQSGDEAVDTLHS